MKDFIRKNGVWIGLFLLVFLFTILSEGSFLSSRNVTNLLRQASINGILACGMTLVILTGGIDLSIGSLVALTSIVVGLGQTTMGWGEMGTTGALLSLTSGVFVGLICGLVNGGLIATLRIPPFVITLGAMVIARGLAMIFSNGSSISPMGESLTDLATNYVSIEFTLAIAFVLIAALVYSLYRSWPQLIFPLTFLVFVVYAFSTYRGLPFLVLFLIICAALTAGLLRYTVFGRSIYAVGSNERAAYWAGVSVTRTLWIVYAIMGFLSGLAGVLLTARLNGADPNAGQLFELDAIAAVVIGGTSLKGGTGTIVGSLIGALMIATLNNGMDLLGVPSFYQMVLKGIIIVAAVSLDRKNASTI